MTSTIKDTYDYNTQAARCNERTPPSHLSAGTYRRHSRPITILHAAEIIRGGVATAINLLATCHTKEFGAENVVCLIPARDVSEIPDFPGSIVTFRRPDRNIGSLLRFTLGFFKSVWMFDPTIVHLHSTFAGIIGRLILLILWPFRRPRVVYCPHGWAFLMDTSPIYRRIYAGIERALAPLTDAVICISEHERAQALQHGLPATKLHVIYNGVCRPDPDIHHADSPYRTSPEIIKLLYVGRFDWQKGFEVLIESLKRLQGSPIHLTAVGANIENPTPPPTLPNVTYTGWLSAKQLAPYFAHADVVVVPSRWEGFGLAAAEAMAHGRAVVASRVCSLPELVIDGTTGLLFEKENDAQLAALLRDTPRERWQEMGKAGRVRYEQHFTAEDYQAATNDLYRKIVG